MALPSAIDADHHQLVGRMAESQSVRGAAETPRSPDGAQRNPGTDVGPGRRNQIYDAPLACRDPGFRFAPSGLRDYATIFCSNAISVSGAVTFGEWLASIS